MTEPIATTPTVTAHADNACADIDGLARAVAAVEALGPLDAAAMAAATARLDGLTKLADQGTIKRVQCLRPVEADDAELAALVAEVLALPAWVVAVVAELAALVAEVAAAL